VRVNWVTAKARVDRWQEEIAHLQEEMLRAVRFMFTRAAQWRALINQCSDARTDVENGLCAYAYHQADQFDEMARSFVSTW
ncbi:hypothetical protein FA95DRAFT_1464686, partial [Auriscalpium vulgare]